MSDYTNFHEVGIFSPVLDPSRNNPNDDAMRGWSLHFHGAVFQELFIKVAEYKQRRVALVRDFAMGALPLPTTCVNLMLEYA